MWVTHPSVAAVTTATFPSRVLPTLGEPPPEKARSPARPTAPHIAPHRPTAFAPRGEGPEGGAGSTGGVGRADEGGRQGGGTGEGGVGSGGLGGTARYGGGSGGIGGLSSYKEVLEQRAVLGEWEALARYWGGALGGYWGGGVGGERTEGYWGSLERARKSRAALGFLRTFPASLGNFRPRSARLGSSRQRHGPAGGGRVPGAARYRRPAPLLPQILPLHPKSHPYPSISPQTLSKSSNFPLNPLNFPFNPPIFL